MLAIPKGIQQQIEAHGVASYPYEGCGLLLGTVEAEKPVRFRIDEQEWVRAELEAMRQGLDVVGVFHSHPDSPPVASPRDLAWAAFAGYSYLITEIRQAVAVNGRSWQLLPDRSGFVEEEIEIRT